MGTTAVSLEGLSFEDGDQEDIIESQCTESDTKFDWTVGHIEDIIMSDEFQRLQIDFLDKYCDEFEDIEENKFAYTDIHKKYTESIERFLTEELQNRMPGFDMEEFQSELVLERSLIVQLQLFNSRKDEITSEIFELLVQFTDFLAFKEMMLDYKANKGQAVELSRDAKDMRQHTGSTDGGKGSQRTSAGGGDDSVGSWPSLTSPRNAAGCCVASDLDLCVIGTAVRSQRDSAKKD